MPLDYKVIRGWPFDDIRQSYGWKDCVLYSLSIGMGKDPFDAVELRHVYEPDLQSFPTMAVVLAHPGFWVREPMSGIAWRQVVHVEQRLQLLRPLPSEGAVAGRTHVTALVDKGVGKGALMVSQRQIRDASSNEPLANVVQISLLRGDGGFSTPQTPQDELLPPLQPTPERQPDAACELSTSPESAVLYRLNGDLNALHVDPEVARAAGFERPILHGLCSYGVAARAVVKTCFEGDASRLKQFDVRFSAPVYPGETLRTEVWREPGGIRFRSVVVGREVVALSHGLAA